MRRSSLVTVVALLFLGPISQAASPPNLYEALVAQQTLAAQHPNDPEILNDLGNLLVLAGSLSEAQGVYERSLEIKPDNSTTRYNLALVLMEQGRGKQAMKQLHQVLEIEPTHAWALYQLGTINEAAGHRSKAVTFYTRALALDPGLASPAVNPHIIENRHLTESQLRLYLAQAEAAQAPRLYQRPNQVAQLLIPTAESTTPTAAEADTSDQAAPGSDEPAAAEPLELQPTSIWEPAESTADDQEEPPADQRYPMGSQDESPESSRVITEEDLVPTTVGQGVGYVGSSRPTSPPPSSLPQERSVTYPRTTPRSGTPSGPAPAQPQRVAPAPQPTPRSQPFVPTIGSTGRLDLELLFEDDTPAVAPGP